MAENSQTRVTIASQQAIFLRGLACMVLSMPGMTVLGEARSEEDLLELCNMLAPDMLLLDFPYTPDQGLSLARQIHEKWRFTKIILFVENAEDPVFQDDHQVPLYIVCRSIMDGEFKAALEQIRQHSQWREEALHESHQHPHLPADASQALTRSSSVFSLQNRNQEIITRELSMAGRIQEDILPEVVPAISGFDIAVRLAPARETSGDFYDFIPLSEHKWGVVVADVTDKGIGAALFMALSSTLIRTFATRFPSLPALVMSTVSERILNDTRGSTFVTTFYGVLESHTGRFVYANGGHPPAIHILRQQGHKSFERLRPTGMALGVSEDAIWKQKFVKLASGDFLVLYTDGITEAQNARSDFYGEDRLLEVALAQPAGRSAADILNAILHDVQSFTGTAPQQDDIALIVIRRL